MSSHLVLVAPHFAPSNLTSVHRARLWAQHLHEFGWRTTILTTHWRHYEETLDWSLMATLPGSLNVVRTPALPLRPVRIVGDIGIRSLPWYCRALSQLHRDTPVDFVHITIPSGFAALLGRHAHDRLGIDYGIDYIDPWVHDNPANRRRFSKAWMSNQAAIRLEPWALKHARLITGVAEGYYADVLERLPRLKAQTVTAAMGYGIALEDFDHARDLDAKAMLFSPDDGGRHLVYAGALLPHGHEIVRQLFEAFAQLRKSHRALFHQLRVHFIGVGHDNVNDPCTHLSELINHFKLHQVVHVVPKRMQYLKVLQHLVRADACIVLGGEKRYYTPSKVYQAMASGTAVLGVLPETSEAWRVLRDYPGACSVGYRRVAEPLNDRIHEQLVRVLTLPRRVYTAANVSDRVFTARDSARALASALNEVQQRARPLTSPRMAASHG